MSDEPTEANLGYAWRRLQRALVTAANDPDPATRQRGLDRAERWHQVIAGVASGALRIGSRRPTEAPTWATPEVIHGGFATGALLAEAPLREDEAALLDGGASLPDARERLNLWYLSDAGQARLRAALASGHYRVDVPEDAALLVVAWLLERDPAAALAIVDELRPWFGRLRFTPRWADAPMVAATSVHVATAHEVATALRAKRASRAVGAMNRTLGVWNPLYDRLVALWCDTVEGELPHLVDGRVAGGVPGRRRPEAWAQRRAALLRDHAAAAALGGGGRHQHRRSNYQRLLRALEATSADDGHSREIELAPEHRASVRLALAGTLTRHGAPGSAERATLRAGQAAIAARPTFDRLYRVVATRLDAVGAEGGVPDVAPMVRPVEAAEGEELAGTEVPDHVVAKVTRALEAPVEELVEREVIGSAEVLAAVLPQLTKRIAAVGIADDALRGLFSQLYAAFRRRRSLLLLDLQHQVRLEELPWVAALAPFRDATDGSAVARETLTQVVSLALVAFPQTLLPNPFVREVGALLSVAGLRLPLVEEVAADIFMGTFTAKWPRAAKVAADLLGGTLYARYYDLPDASAWDAPPPKRRLLRRRPPEARDRAAEAFAALCRSRSLEAQRVTPDRWSVAANGAVLEQSQILTTHNLAVLVDGLGLREAFAPRAEALAARAFGAVAAVRLPAEGHARMRGVKNAAYAWRQALFFASLCPDPAQRRIFEGFREALEAAEASWASRLAPAVVGLEAVLRGDRFSREGTSHDGGRRFLGWSVGPHWLLDTAASPHRRPVGA